LKGVAQQINEGKGLLELEGTRISDDPHQGEARLAGIVRVPTRSWRC
jgi:hypothetical protein